MADFSCFWGPEEGTLSSAEPRTRSSRPWLADLHSLSTLPITYGLAAVAFARLPRRPGFLRDALAIPASTGNASKLQAGCHPPDAIRLCTRSRSSWGLAGRLHRCLVRLQWIQAATIFAGVSRPPSCRAIRCSAVARSGHNCLSDRPNRCRNGSGSFSHIGSRQ